MLGTVLSGSYLFLHLTYIEVKKVDTLFVPALHMKKLRLREVRSPAYEVVDSRFEYGLVGL